VYVSQQSVPGGPVSVFQFAASANGIVTPAASFTGAPNDGSLAYTLATDVSGQVYVGLLAPVPNSVTSTPEVLVYAAGSGGTTAPVRTILGSTATFNVPAQIAVDSAGQIYVLDATGLGISVFSSTADGMATPTRTISGPMTQLGVSINGSAMSVDASGNIYAFLNSLALTESTWSIQVFPPTATGNVAPDRTITATNPTPVSQPITFALDASGNLYVGTLAQTSGAIVGTILEFGSSGPGVATPVRSITGAKTGLGWVKALSVDKAGNLYVLTYAGSAFGGAMSVEGFSASGSGNLAPTTQFTSSSLSATALGQLALQ
jgi:hypothetical protein